jgi:hypothetical protein
MLGFKQYLSEQSELEVAREVFGDIIDDESKVVEDSAREGVEVFSMMPYDALVGEDIGVMVANLFNTTQYKFITINSDDGQTKTFEKGSLTEAKDTPVKKFASNTGKKVIDSEQHKKYYIVQLKDGKRVYIVDKNGKAIYDTDTWDEAKKYIYRN